MNRSARTIAATIFFCGLLLGSGVAASARLQEQMAVPPLR